MPKLVTRRPNQILTDVVCCSSIKITIFASKGMQDRGFKQLVNNATHIEGGLIDHVYVYDSVSKEYKLQD